jgi:hypothetical protein
MDRAGGGRHVRDRVDPQVGNLDGLLDLTASDITDDRVALGSHRLAGHVGGELDVERLNCLPGEHGLELGTDDGHGGGVHLVDAHGSQGVGHFGVVAAAEHRREHRREVGFVRFVRVGWPLVGMIRHAGLLDLLRR